MKPFLAILVIALVTCGCETVSPDAVNLSVSFTWDGMRRCSRWHPEVRVTGLPKTTRTLSVHMFDHVYRHDHGTMKIPYAGTGIIPSGTGLQSPCPPFNPGRYRITVKALDADGVVIGTGSFERLYPEDGPASP